MQAPAVAEDRLWTVADVSYYLGVPVATLYQWRCASRGPRSRRVGRYLRSRPGQPFRQARSGQIGRAHV